MRSRRAYINAFFNVGVYSAGSHHIRSISARKDQLILGPFCSPATKVTTSETPEIAQLFEVAPVAQLGDIAMELAGATRGVERFFGFYNHPRDMADRYPL